MAEQQRVSIGVGLGDDGAADGAAGARPVVDHDRLAEAVRHLLADDAAEEIGRSTRRERHDQRHGRDGIVLGRTIEAAPMAAARPSEIPRNRRRLSIPLRPATNLSAGRSESTKLYRPR